MNAPIRVLHVMTDPVFGAILLEPILRQQREHGYRIEIAAGPGEAMGQLTRMGFPVHLIHVNRHLVSFAHFRALAELVRITRRGRYDVIHLHNPITSVLGRIAARTAPRPIVFYHMHGSYWDSPRLSERLIFDYTERALRNFADNIITINSEDTDDLIRRGIKDAASITCLRVGSGGVDLARFDPSAFTPEDRARTRQALGISPSDFVVGFVGRLVEIKGITDLVEAFSGVAGACERAKLVIVGSVLRSERDQETGPRVMRRAEEDPSLRGRVVFTGFRRDVPALMSTMDVLVMPSRQEHFGLVQAEAGAMSLPVISTDTRGGREAIENGRNGILVPVENPEVLREAILLLAEREDLRKRMAEAGRARACALYDERRIFERINAAYERLLGARAGGAALT
ncbi:MAG TPA: glycosyltransferase family 4 protein [Gammaproteobacteria bacterium]